MDELRIAVVGKDVGVTNAYIHVEEAIKLVASFKDISINIAWIDSHNVNKENVATLLKGYNGILIPGGFNFDGVEGMILAINYARSHAVPFFGICLGMQLTVIEFARNIVGLKEATSSEFDNNSKQKVIDRIPGLEKGKLLEGKLPCLLKANSLIEKCYQSLDIVETFNHGYAFNNEYVDLLEEKGLILSALSSDGKLIEAVELANRPFFLAVQFHPELTEPNKPHPLFLGFIEAAINNKQ